LVTTGICGWIDITDPVERAKFELEYEQREKDRAVAQAEEEAALAAKHEREETLTAVYDKIESAILPYIHDAAAAVNTSARIAPEDRKVFDRFKEYCGTWNPPLPPLPANPAAVCAFLTSELDRGITHFTNRCNAISRVHLAVGMPDPTRDVLCQALIRTVNEKEHR
jgi:hypothetical protein